MNKNTSVLTNKIEQIRLRTQEQKTEQSMFDFESPDLLPTTDRSSEGDLVSANSGRQKLLPVRHTNRDFFLCDMFDYALKDDGASMEVPIFTLSTKPDLTTWAWQSKDGSRRVEVYPSVKSRATQHDKDVLIFVISQMTEALNRGSGYPYQRCTAGFRPLHTLNVL